MICMEWLYTRGHRGRLGIIIVSVEALRLIISGIVVMTRPLPLREVLIQC